MKRASLLILSLFIVSCAGRQVRTEGEIISSLYQKKDYDQVISKINDKEVYEREEDRFLRSSEVAMAHFNKGEYEKSLNELRRTKEIANELYRISISNKLESLFLGDATDVYYPNEFEQANIRFYEIIGHFNMSTIADNSKRPFHRQAMESTLRDWSAYLENFKTQNKGKAIYKGSTFMDFMGVIVHDTLNRSRDRSIARNFKKTGKRNLKQQMGLYPSFNNNFKKYQDDYDKLHLLSSKELDKYIDKTDAYKKAEEFFDSKKFYNTYVLILDGRVKPKKPKLYDWPLGLPAAVYIGSNDGRDDFTTFAFKMLAVSRGTEPSISFELPKIDSVKHDKLNKVKIVSKDKKKVIDGEAILLANTSEVLGQSLAVDAAVLKAKIGTRLAVKHVALLTSAYETYKALYEKNGAFLAYLGASAAYSIGNKAIKESELADIRSWYGLFDHIQMFPVNLEEGDYTVEYKGKKYDIKRAKGSKQIVPLIINE